MRSVATLLVLLLMLLTVTSYFVSPIIADARIREELGDPDAFVTDTARTPWAYASSEGVFSIQREECYDMQILRVPESVNGVTVTSLGNFFEKPLLRAERMILPGTVKDPDIYYRLSEWISLKELVIREGAEDISRLQIAALPSLEAVYIPRSTTKIGNVFLARGDGKPVVYYAGTEAEWDTLGKGAARLKEAFDVVFETAVPEKWIEETK